MKSIEEQLVTLRNAIREGNHDLVGTFVKRDRELIHATDMRRCTAFH